MTAGRTNGGTSYGVDVLGLHVRWNGPNGVNFQGEYYDGDRLDHSVSQLNDIEGWYGQLEYAPPKTEATLFYRYDEYDETHTGSSVDDYARHTFGVAWDVAHHERVTVQWENVDHKGSTGDNIGVQWQTKY